MRGVLGRLSDQPRERDERERGENEERDVSDAQAVEHDHERSKGE
jgi:hypothetical protein